MLSECLQSRRLQWPTLCHLIVDRDTMGKVMDCGLHVIVGVPGSCKRVGKFVMQPGTSYWTWMNLAGSMAIRNLLSQY